MKPSEEQIKAYNRIYSGNRHLLHHVWVEMEKGRATIVYTKANTCAGLAKAINKKLPKLNLTDTDIVHEQNTTLFFFLGGVIVTQNAFIG